MKNEIKADAYFDIVKSNYGLFRWKYDSFGNLLDSTCHWPELYEKFFIFTGEIRECCQYILSHPTEKLTVPQLAARFGYTDYYFSRKFHEETGEHLLSYIRRSRKSATSSSFPTATCSRMLSAGSLDALPLPTAESRGLKRLSPEISPPPQGQSYLLSSGIHDRHREFPDMSHGDMLQPPALHRKRSQ